MSREAVILAGGMGTRLKSLVGDRPKPMALVNGKPFLRYLFRHLLKNDFRHIILAVGFRHEFISEYFGNRFEEMELSYAVETKPLGTGGGIRNALRYSTAEYSFILNGDTYFPVSFEEMELLSAKKTSDLTIALRRLEDVSRFGSIFLDKSQKLSGFIEKKPQAGPGLINGGIYYLRNQAFKELKFPENFSFEKDYLMKYAQIQNFYGIVFNNYFIDIGIPESLIQAQTDFFKFEE